MTDTTQTATPSTRFTRTTRVLLLLGIVLLLAGAAMGVSWINRPTVSVPVALSDGDYVQVAPISEFYHFQGCRRLPQTARPLLYRGVKAMPKRPCPECMAPTVTRPPQTRLAIASIACAAGGMIIAPIAVFASMRRRNCRKCGGELRGTFCARCGAIASDAK